MRDGVRKNKGSTALHLFTVAQFITETAVGTLAPIAKGHELNAVMSPLVTAYAASIISAPPECRSLCCPTPAASGMDTPQGRPKARAS